MGPEIPLSSSQRLRIVGLGDSTTAGTPGFLSPLEAPPDGAGDEQSQYAYWMMRSHPDWEVLNRGINGERSDQILGRFRRDVVASEPDFVIVLAGVNDVYQDFPLEFTEGNLGKMYDIAKREEVRLVTASILPFNSMSHRRAIAMKNLNRWIEARSRVLSALFCDTSAAVSDRLNSTILADSPDGLHPGVEGYRRMGEALTRVVERGLGC